MKKIISTMIACTIMILTGVSCSQEDSLFDGKQTGKEVSFSPSFGQTTRATETAFENGDEISVFAVDPTTGLSLQTTNYADNVRYRYNSSTGLFNAVNSSIGISEANTTGLAYYAIYPYIENVAPVTRVTIGNDQSTHAKYSARDLCTAYAAPTTNQQVDLTFTHRLCNIVIEIEGNNLASKTISMRAANVMCTFLMDLNNNSFTCEGNKNEILMTSAYNNAYQCIIPPQTITEGTTLFIATVDGKDYTFYLTSDVTFQSGRQYNYKVKLEGEKMIVISGSINPWNTDTPDTPDTPTTGEKMESDAALEVMLTAAERVGGVLIMDYTIKNVSNQDINNLKIETQEGRDGLGKNYGNHCISIGEGSFDYYTQTITKLRKGASVECHIKVENFDATNKTKEFTTTELVSASNYTFTKNYINFYTDKIIDNRVLSNGIQTPDRKLEFSVNSCKVNQNGFVVLNYTIKNLTSDIISNFNVEKYSARDDQNNQLNSYVSLNGSEYDYHSTKADIPANGSITGSIMLKGKYDGVVSTTASSVTCYLSCSSSNYVLEDNYIRFLNVAITK